MAAINSYRKAARISAIVIVGALWTPAAKGVVPEYRILDLGTLGGIESKAHALNDIGQVVGWSSDSIGTKRGFLTSANSPIDPLSDSLPMLNGGTASYAYGINAAGQIAGVTTTASGDRAYLYSGGTLTDLGTFGGEWAYAYAINGVGHVVGGAAKTPFALTYPTHAFIYDGSLHDLGTLGGAESYGYSINSTGQVVGYSQLQLTPTGYSPIHGFLWTPNSTNGTTGTMTDLPTLGGLYGYAWGINDAGQIVGGANTEGDLAYHAFLRSSGPSPTMLDLDTLGGSSSEAHAINSIGMIVGYADTSASSHAFLYADGAMHDLNALIPGLSGWELTDARAINNRAQITGWGTSPSGQTHGFLLTPLPTWLVDASGNWSTPGNWLGPVPDGAGAEAHFTGAITAPRIVTLDSPRTVGRVVFDNANSYTLEGPGTLSFSGLTGETGIEVRSGSHEIAAPLHTLSPTSVTLASASQLKLSGHLYGSISALALGSDSTLDLVRNSLVIDYNPADGSPLPTVTAAIISGRNGGSWNGTGITSSAAATDPIHATALACAEASTLGIGSFNGVALDGSDVLIKYSYYGDANLDGQVDISDLGVLATSWQTSAAWSGGDFNYDGFVDISDLGLLATNWQQGVGSPLGPSFNEALASVGLSGVSVPEPAMSLFLALIGGIIAVKRQRGRAREIYVVP